MFLLYYSLDVSPSHFLYFSAKEYMYVKSFHLRLPVPVISVDIIIVNNYSY
jgi:hypothetical protein